MARKNESNNQIDSRSTRMYQQDSSWFFNTREGNVVGPFRDELEAYTQLEVYIRLADSGMLPSQEVSLDALRTKRVG